MQLRHIPYLTVPVIALVAIAALAKAPMPTGSDPYTPAALRPVDLVICLDTSGSMTHLIDSARARIWDIVNELATAKPTPQLRVGLLTYGSPNLSTAAAGWVVRQTDLTNDLDTVYAKMMAMSTNGGDEFVGWVLNDAVKTMSWSSDPAALRIIFVAGNESADQAAEQFNFRSVAELARSRDIVINAIYCGKNDLGIREQWDKVSQHGGGSYAAIDMQRGTFQIPTPQDSLLLQLNTQLNATYVPFGTHGRRGCENQVAQDSNATSVGEQSISSRVVAKASVLYGNAFWDLVDAYAQKDFELDEVGDKDLPENMKSMTPAERKAYVEGLRMARTKVQQEIKEADVARKRFLKKERRKSGKGQKGLDDAILKALREQAEAKGFEFQGE